MSLDVGPTQRSASPQSSGRSSPVGRYTKAHTEDEALRKDKTYRRYASGVERALSLFDSTLQEWADYISFLSRLLKVLQAHPSNITAVPYKAIVAKRLSQCLNPNLPSGVHQKALEVYNFVFELIGTNALSRDLSIYFPGLSLTLTFASLSVRPAFLSLLEDHILQIRPTALRPALRSIILALLPGLEEETSEDFDRIFRVFEAFKKAVNRVSPEETEEGAGDEYFWQCFFLACITSPSRRQGALAFLVRKLPKVQGDAQGRRSSATPAVEKENAPKGLPPSVEAIVSPEPGLLVRCFASGLSDDQLLIQRGYLDLLVTHLPLHSTVLQERVSKDDLERLVAAAVGVVTRRDMSLNRRLWTWILGPETHAQSDADTAPNSPVLHATGTSTPTGIPNASRTRYFEQFGLEALVNGIQKSIGRESANPAERARPFRICLSLMDRWEVGGLVIPSVFRPSLDSVRRYENIATSKEQFSDVLRSASVFFDGVESGLIWGELMNLIYAALKDSSVESDQRIQKLELVRFIITHFNVREEEMLAVHIPLVALAVLTLLDEIKSDAAVDPQITISALAIAEILIDMIPERSFRSKSGQGGPSSSHHSKHDEKSEDNEIVRSIRSFYAQAQGNLDISKPPFSARETAQLLLRQSISLVTSFLEPPGPKDGLDAWTRPLVLLLQICPKTDGSVRTELLAVIKRAVESTTFPTDAHFTFATFAAIVTVTTSLAALGQDKRATATEGILRELTPLLVREAWFHLSPCRPQHHVEVTRCLWQLQSGLHSSEHGIEAAISSLMAANQVHGSFASYPAEAGKRFSVLWTHTMSIQSVQSDLANGSHISKDTSKGPPGGPNYEIMLTRPLFLLLDSLENESSELFVFVRSWLQALPNADKLFNILVRKLLQSDGLSPVDQTLAKEETRTSDDTNDTEPDLDSYLYYLRTLSNVLRWSSNRLWSTLANDVAHVDGTGAPLLTARGFEDGLSLQSFFTQACMRAIQYGSRSDSNDDVDGVTKLRRVALSTLQQILLNPYAAPLSEYQLEYPLLDVLLNSLQSNDAFGQVPLLDAVLAALKLSTLQEPPAPPPLHRRTTSRETNKSSRLSFSMEKSEKEQLSVKPPNPPPPQLMKCLEGGFCSEKSRPVLDSWVNFLAECLPLYSETIFQILIPLVETFCSQINQIFEKLQGTFVESDGEESIAPEATLIALFNGLEQMLARAHDRLITDEMRSANVKPVEQPQGFFGNMVSGVFSSESLPSRRATANDRLTVLLSFKDTVRICFAVWSWGGHGAAGSTHTITSAASFNYTSLRIRNRARRLLEHLFVAETLECLETIVEMWRTSTAGKGGPSPASVFSLLHVLDGSRPKNTIPAIFNAIYSRTNPNALEPTSKSTLTSEIADTSIVAFLIEYARSLDDDAMDEIWTDCMTFLRDVLANPFPHRQILPALLDFTAILGAKADNTSFGEQRKMRRELSDVFMRLLTAAFTTKPMAFSQERPQSPASERADSPARRSEANSVRPPLRSDDVVTILAAIVPTLPKILVDSDRVLGAATIISTSVIGPIFRSKTFPDNVTLSVLDLLYEITRLSNARKSWKKDINDAFNDARFFTSPLPLVQSHWLALLRQWTLGDKDRLPEILSRISAPTTAGIMFGVGAASARMEADRKTQLNLRRIGTLVLAAAEDAFIINIAGIQEKIVELLTATAASSPSSATRAEVYMVLRALLLRVSPVHLAPLWPIINAELQAALSSVLPGYTASETAADTYENPAVLLQACKLLDTLIMVAPDDFQLHEWLYITDTIDAVYRPDDWAPTALVDELAHELGATATNVAQQHATAAAHADVNGPQRLRKPLLQLDSIDGGGAGTQVVQMSKEDLLVRVLQPFFSQLSIYAFESTYSMGAPDLTGCADGVLADLFDEATVVGN